MTRPAPLRYTVRVLTARCAAEGREPLEIAGTTRKGFATEREAFDFLDFFAKGVVVWAEIVPFVKK